MSVYAGKYGEKRTKKQPLLTLSTTQKKQTTQKTAKRNCPNSVAFYDTRPGNEVSLIYSAPEPTRGYNSTSICLLFVLLSAVIVILNYWNTSQC